LTFNQLFGLVDTSNKPIVICTILLNTTYLKVNQHTSYLRSKLGSNNILNKKKDSSTYNILILGIFLINFIINCKDLGIKFLRSWISRRLKLDILNIRFLDFVNLFNRLLCCLNWILFGLLILFLF